MAQRVRLLWRAKTGAMPIKVFYSPQVGLVLKPIRPMRYFIVKEGWSIWSLLRNPMVNAYPPPRRPDLAAGMPSGRQVSPGWC